MRLKASQLAMNRDILLDNHRPVKHGNLIHRGTNREE